MLSIQSQLTPNASEYERRFRVTDPSLPFAANNLWSEAVCINVRVDPNALRPLVPDVFELDLYRGYAFVSITVSRLKSPRIVWMPSGRCLAADPRPDCGDSRLAQDGYSFDRNES